MKGIVYIYLYFSITITLPWKIIMFILVYVNDIISHIVIYFDFYHHNDMMTIVIIRYTIV